MDDQPATPDTADLITPDELLRLIGAPHCPLIVDVRSDDAFEAEPVLVPGSIRRPAEAVASWAEEVAGPVVVLCRHGHERSQGAAAWLRARGREAQVLDGGMAAWIAAGLPTRMRVPATLILTRAELSGLMTPADWLAAVEQGFLALAEGRAVSPAPMHLPAVDGGFHLKAASWEQEGAWAAFKVNANFPLNPAQGRPTIQGLLLLFDAATGAPVAVMDSIEITRRRTAAATALAARHLARPDSAHVLICGCGDQALAQLEALAGVLPIRAGFAFDLDPAKASAFARQAAGVVELEPVPPAGFARAARASDVIVTCTTARAPFLAIDHVAPGTFIAAVGADSPDKSEIAPALMAKARVYADDLAQCLAMGDLRHAVAAGAMIPAAVAGDLAGLVAGRVPGRGTAAEITVFDSTGTAIQDVAAAVAVYGRAKAAGLGAWLPLADP